MGSSAPPSAAGAAVPNDHGVPAPLIEPTNDGLYCHSGGFHIDPWRPVPRAIITHAHGDHAAWGCGAYLTSRAGAGVLRARIGPDAPVEALEERRPIDVGGVRVSLHPAGHILGSCQVRVETPEEVWVVSGDYKLQLDPTCTPFEPVPCDVFITESTFALPVYRWPDPGPVFDEINAWWRENAAAGRTSVIFAYALGKAQRVLAGLDPSIGPIGVHGAVARMNDAYREAGVPLPSAAHATGDAAKELRGRGLVVAPPSAASSPWLRKLAGSAREGISTAMASGWMLIRGMRRRRAVDRGFVISDHADWPDLLRAIEQTGARRVGVTHGYTEPMVRWLSEKGLDAYTVPTRYEGERAEAGDIAEPAGDPNAPPPAEDA